MQRDAVTRASTTPRTVAAHRRAAVRLSAMRPWQAASIVHFVASGKHRERLVDAADLPQGSSRGGVPHKTQDRSQGECRTHKERKKFKAITWISRRHRWKTVRRRVVFWPWRTCSSRPAHHPLYREEHSVNTATGPGLSKRSKSALWNSAV